MRSSVRFRPCVRKQISRLWIRSQYLMKVQKKRESICRQCIYDRNETLALAAYRKLYLQAMTKEWKINGENVTIGVAKM